MSDFTQQYAIRLPDGSLYLVPEPPSSSLLGGLLPKPEPRKPRIAVWGNEANALSALDQLRTEAQKLGVSNIGAAVVSRIVGPWSDPDFGGFLAAVEGLANGEAA